MRVLPKSLLFRQRWPQISASPMTIGLLAPLYRQMDPIRLAEVQRQVRAISDYGERIAKSNVEAWWVKAAAG